MEWNGKGAEFNSQQRVIEPLCFTITCEHVHCRKHIFKRKQLKPSIDNLP